MGPITPWIPGGKKEDKIRTTAIINIKDPVKKEVAINELMKEESL